MSMQTDLQVFERAVEAKGRLLRIEGDRTGPTPRQLVLTFDVGRISIRPTDDGLSTSLIEDRAVMPGDLVPLDEEEPWWRLLGQPLTAAWPGGIEDAVADLSAGVMTGHPVDQSTGRGVEQDQRATLAARGDRNHRLI